MKKFCFSCSGLSSFFSPSFVLVLYSRLVRETCLEWVGDKHWGTISWRIWGFLRPRQRQQQQEWSSLFLSCLLSFLSRAERVVQDFSLCQRWIATRSPVRKKRGGSRPFWGAGIGLILISWTKLTVLNVWLYLVTRSRKCCPTRI